MGWQAGHPGRLRGRGDLRGWLVAQLSNGYGWLWWVGTEIGRTFFARGYGGQLIYVVPELDLVVVVTSDPEAGGLDPKILISQTILPTVT